jgi:hypothetical protein
MRRVILFLLAVMLTAAAAAAQTPPRITRIEFSPAPQAEGGGVLISLLGSGECTYTIDYGDGKTERRTANLPDRMRHAYAADTEYTVVATPVAPCEGVARARIDIRSITRGIWRLTVEPGPAPDAPEIIVTVHGRGVCAVALDFGDGKQRKFDGPLPTTLRHTYDKAGTYELRAVAADPCRGDIRMSIEVRH